MSKPIVKERGREGVLHFPSSKLHYCAKVVMYMDGELWCLRTFLKCLNFALPM